MNPQASYPYLTWETSVFPNFGPPTGYSVILFNKYVIIFRGDYPMGKPGLNPEGRLYAIDLEENKWYEGRLEGDVSMEKVGHTSCLYKNNKIIVFGESRQENENDQEISTNEIVEITLDIIEDGFSARGKVLKKTNNRTYERSCHTANIYGSEIYVFGGFIGLETTPTNNLSMFDLETLQWTECQTSGTKPEARANHSSAVYGSKLFVGGGFVYDRKGDLWVIDLKELRWYEISQKRDFLPAAVSTSFQIADNELYFFEGYKEGSSVFSETILRNNLRVYDIESNTWKEVALQGEPPTKPGCHPSVYYQGQIILFQGYPQLTTYSFRIKEHSKNIMKTESAAKGDIVSYIAQIKTLFLNQSYADVTFVLQGKELFAHKNILAMRSKYFANMFTSGMTESQLSKIDISDIQYLTFKALLEFIYCNEVELDLSLALELLEVSDKFSFGELKTVCEEFLEQQINLDNFVDLAHASERFDAGLLRESVIKYVMKNRQMIAKREGDGHLDISKLLLWEIVFRIGQK